MQSQRCPVSCQCIKRIIACGSQKDELAILMTTFSWKLFKNYFFANGFKVYFLLHSYFAKYHRSGLQFSGRVIGMDGLTVQLNPITWCLCNHGDAWGMYIRCRCLRILSQQSSGILVKPTPACHSHQGLGKVLCHVVPVWRGRMHRGRHSTLSMQGQLYLNTTSCWCLSSPCESHIVAGVKLRDIDNSQLSAERLLGNSNPIFYLVHSSSY